MKLRDIGSFGLKAAAAGVVTATAGYGIGVGALAYGAWRVAKAATQSAVGGAANLRSGYYDNPDKARENFPHKVIVIANGKSYYGTLDQSELDKVNRAPDISDIKTRKTALTEAVLGESGNSHAFLIASAVANYSHVGLGARYKEVREALDSKDTKVIIIEEDPANNKSKVTVRSVHNDREIGRPDFSTSDSFIEIAGDRIVAENSKDETFDTLETLFTGLERSLEDSQSFMDPAKWGYFGTLLDRLLPGSVKATYYLEESEKLETLKSKVAEAEDFIAPNGTDPSPLQAHLTSIRASFENGNTVEAKAKLGALKTLVNQGGFDNVTDKQRLAMTPFNLNRLEADLTAVGNPFNTGLRDLRNLGAVHAHRLEQFYADAIAHKGTLAPVTNDASHAAYKTEMDLIMGSTLDTLAQLEAIVETVEDERMKARYQELKSRLMGTDRTEGLFREHQREIDTYVAGGNARAQGRNATAFNARYQATAANIDTFLTDVVALAQTINQQHLHPTALNAGALQAPVQQVAPVALAARPAAGIDQAYATALEAEFTRNFTPRRDQYLSGLDQFFGLEANVAAVAAQGAQTAQGADLTLPVLAAGVRNAVTGTDIAPRIQELENAIAVVASSATDADFSASVDNAIAHFSAAATNIAAAVGTFATKLNAAKAALAGKEHPAVMRLIIDELLQNAPNKAKLVAALKALKDSKLIVGSTKRLVEAKETELKGHRMNSRQSQADQLMRLAQSSIAVGNAVESDDSLSAAQTTQFSDHVRKLKSKARKPLPVLVRGGNDIENFRNHLRYYTELKKFFNNAVNRQTYSEFERKQIFVGVLKFIQENRATQRSSFNSTRFLPASLRAEFNADYTAIVAPFTNDSTRAVTIAGDLLRGLFKIEVKNGNTVIGFRKAPLEFSKVAYYASHVNDEDREQIEKLYDDYREALAEIEAVLNKDPTKWQSFVAAVSQAFKRKGSKDSQDNPFKELIKLYADSNKQTQAAAPAAQAAAPASLADALMIALKGHLQGGANSVVIV